MAVAVRGCREEQRRQGAGVAVGGGGQRGAEAGVAGACGRSVRTTALSG